MVITEPSPTLHEKVFISYSHADGIEFVSKLHDKLEESGLSAWFDDHLTRGIEWDNQIQEKLISCEFFLFIATENSMKSENCADEWSFALDNKKHIIIVRTQPENPLDLHFRLRRRQHALFGVDFEMDFAALYKDMIELQEITESVRQDARQFAELQLKLSQETQQRIVNRPPKLNPFFKDRVRETDYITSELLDDNSIYNGIFIYGRGGIGKTELACRVLSILEKDYDNVNGIIYLSTGGTRDKNTMSLEISFERIYHDTLKLLSDDERSAMLELWNDISASIDEKILRLVDYYHEKRYIIFIDNIEDLLNQEQRFKDIHLDNFINTFLEGHHKSRLIATSRVEVQFDYAALPHTRSFPLDEGLPVKDAVKLLRDFDASGRAGIRDADDNLLEQIVAKVHGLPRALEYINGIVMKPRNSLQKLLTDDKLFRRDIMDALMKEVHGVLSDNEKRVVQGLAIYGVPITDHAIEYMLIDFMEQRDIEDAILTLIESRMVSENKSSGRLSLHPLDASYALSDIPVISQDGYDLKNLHIKAAEYYRFQRLEQEQWVQIDALEPQFREFNHLILAEQFDEAAILVQEIDYAYLSLWGYFDRIRQLRTQLLDRITSPQLAAANLAYLGYTFYLMNDLKQAIASCEQALQIAEPNELVHEEALSLNILGLIYSARAEFERALEYHLAARPLFQQTGSKYWDAAMLVNSGYCYIALGEYVKARDNFQESISIDYDLVRDDVAWDYQGLGEAQLYLHDYESSIQNSQKALELALATGAAEIVTMSGIVLAEAYLASKKEDGAQKIVSVLDTITKDRYYTPQFTHFAMALRGISQLKLAQEIAAKATFYEALDIIETIETRHRSPNVNVKFIRAVCLCGLALLTQDGNYGSYIQEALEALTEAKKKLSYKGIYDEYYLIFSFLFVEDKNEILKPIDTLFASIDI